jgi:peptidase C39-like protein
MPVSEDLTVDYHQQDTDYYCGAACAQMVLDSIGTGLLSQDDLYNDNHSHSTAEGRLVQRARRRLVDDEQSQTAVADFQQLLRA